MSFLAYIPARKNSLRIKNKNILNLEGKPLITHTLSAAKKSKYINDIYVSTDSNKIKTIVIKEGIYFHDFRIKKLAGSKISMHELLKNELKILKKNFQFDYIVLLQPTSPLRTAKDIDNSCKLFLKNKNKVNCLVSTSSPYKTCDQSKIMYSDGKYLKFEKKKNFTIRRLRNGPAIIIVKKDEFKKSLISDKILDFKMSKIKSVDINFYKDFEEVKKILNKR